MMMKNNMLSLSKLFLDENEALNFAYNNGLLYTSMKCNKCSEDMILSKDSSTHTGYVWYCPKCYKKTSILLHSIFSHAKLPFNKVLHLLYCWSHDYSSKLAQFEVDVNKNTVAFYYKQFRSACFEYICNQDSPLIGGEGKTVEIDETLISKRKYHRGRMLTQVWVFGGICRETGEIFMRVVDDRTAPTLIDAIQQCIAPGTKIISDQWKAYNELDNSYSNTYTHETVNHSKNFVDPITKANTQRIERLWRDLKDSCRKKCGIPRKDVELHLAEFVFKHYNMRNNSVKFIVAVQLMANTTFSPQ